MGIRAAALAILGAIVILNAGCQSEAEETLDLSDAITHPETGHQYLLSDVGTWEAAQAQAEALGGHLVVINDAAEQQWLVTNFSYQNSGGYLAGEWQAPPFAYWIGLSDVQQEGQFVWVTGESLTFENFAPGEPNNQSPEGWDEDYVAFALDPAYSPIPGVWNDGNQERGQARGIIEISS
ncbi:MAG: C-type lectin domain-containing protein [Cyanobacteria bacterium P01_D01_bin.128]